MVVDPLAHVWDEVVWRIMREMMELSAKDTEPLHINLRAEMTLELAKLQLRLSECVIDKRTVDRQLEGIEPKREQEECLGPAGEASISSTARLVFERMWSKRMKERWQPKSAKAIEREKNPKSRAKLPIKLVAKNHYIPLWFIRDHWALNDTVLRWRKATDGWRSAVRPLGNWGYRYKLYSDELEAYFSLLEGDAKRPLEKLLATEPLNAPEQNALVAFLIIQVLRNPRFIEVFHEGAAPLIAQLGDLQDPDAGRRTYESLFENDELYDLLARPIMWSRWAVVKSRNPVFVLPDRFCLHGAGEGGLRIIVPLSPNACFVTLPTRESEKRIVPWYLTLDDELAETVSANLVSAAVREFLSDRHFEAGTRKPTPVFRLLHEIEDAVRAKSDDY
jgi:hypothetical protein